MKRKYEEIWHKVCISRVFETCLILQGFLWYSLALKHSNTFCRQKTGNQFQHMDLNPVINLNHFVFTKLMKSRKCFCFLICPVPTRTNHMVKQCDKNCQRNKLTSEGQCIKPQRSKNSLYLFMNKLIVLRKFGLFGCTIFFFWRKQWLFPCCNIYFWFLLWCVYSCFKDVRTCYTQLTLLLNYPDCALLGSHCNLKYCRLCIQVKLFLKLNRYKGDSTLIFEAEQTL